MADFFWFSDEQWARIVPLLPTDVRGMKRVDDRRVLSGIVHALKCGGRWGPAVGSLAWRPPHPLVHHYMIDDEESFVRKVVALARWSPQVRHSAPDATGEKDGTGSQVRFRDFKTAWWRLYESGGERALRDYFRTSFMISAAALAGHVERRELVQDTAFADWMRTR